MNLSNQLSLYSSFCAKGSCKNAGVLDSTAVYAVLSAVIYGRRAGLELCVSTLTIFSCVSKDATFGPYAWHAEERNDCGLPENPAEKWLQSRCVDGWWDVGCTHLQFELDEAVC